MLIALAVINLAIAALCLRAEHRISALKTYYPMLRRIFAVLAALYGASGIAAFSGHLDTTIFVRVVGAGGGLAVMLWANQFIDLRNRTPQYIVVDRLGHIERRTDEELRFMTLTVLSWARHGAMPDEVVAQVETALAQWYEHRAWRARLGAEIVERHAAHEAAQGEGE